MAVKTKGKKVKVRSEESESSNGFNLDSFLKEAKKRSAEVAKVAKKRHSVDEGDYIARLNSMTFNVDEAKGRASIRQRWIVLEGESVGSQVDKYTGLEDRGLEFFFKDMYRLGWDPEEIDVSSKQAIEELCEEVSEAKPVAKIAVRDQKDNPEYQNVFINSLIEDYEDEEDEDSDEEEEDSEEEDEDEESPEENEDEDDEADEDEEKEEDEESDEDEDEDEEAELEEGMTVSFVLNGEQMEGEVIELPNKDIARVKVGKKTYRVPQDQLEITEE